MDTAGRFESVKRELDEACERAGRDPREVTLVAVSKTVGAQEVAQAIGAGAMDFGENRPDQLMAKADAFPQVRWHMIGNIQSRRIRDVVGRAALVHSVFEERHAAKVDEVASERGLVQDILLEVNVSGERSKSGLAPDDVEATLRSCCGLPNLRVRGLMTMAPQGDAEVARRVFRDLKALRDKLASRIADEYASAFTELSMGMSEDWREAVEEGATIVRVGRAIFSDSF